MVVDRYADRAELGLRRKQSADEKAWAIAATVCDPEIPVLTVEDLGILRSVHLFDDGGFLPAVECTITPTYSGCPAMDAIRDDLSAAFKSAGYPSVHVQLVLSPTWTTDWMSEAGKAKLAAYGIAAPSGRSAAGGHSGTVRLSLQVKCPQCSSLNTKELTRFGSTSCKALYVCQDCREPFDYFKVL
ncbi:phenylacetate-CoA oxygenase subunit PaaJ [Paenarthrobacter sp. Z7-10]|uniref:1,2-phenylacetyl-CoA epoxidase subunit PaaD n=1 Tax=Paenarthrobacter sp. Z7-10 TaxID=2787635 RepID=UPI0022A98F28|nr:1,2-phenylacetyl-CoA epoxidase subunit PaaD [Paenarthrobacter sp. Z7-10]MCZ2402321.1 phenylacetate-CoA oxygenase subunit PaaJ [Paenarthrobacter sp. Z7-10]